MSYKTNFQEKLVTNQQIEELKDNYVKKNYTFINAKRPANLPDANEFAYSLDEIEDYIAYFKAEAAKKGLKNLGLKIVLGQYPEDRIFGKHQNPNTKGYQTICIVPTAENETIQTLEEGTQKSANGISGLDFGTLRPPY